MGLEYPATQTPTPNHVPRARENGKIDSGWVDSTGLGVTTTPTPNGIPQALPSGKLDSGWIDFPEAETGQFAPLEAPYLLVSIDPSVPNARVLAGTANQVILTDGGINNELTLSLPQNIHTGATPTFDSLTLTTDITTPEVNLGLAGFINDASGVLQIAGNSDVSIIAGIVTLSGLVTIGDGSNVALATGTGTQFGTAANQKQAWWGAAPVVQGAAIIDAAGGATVDAEARAAINTLLARMRTYGLIAT